MKWQALLVVALFISVSAEAEVLWEFDFDQGAPPQLLLQGASAVRDQDKVISGRGSLHADFSGSGSDWNEFLKTQEGVVFQPGKTYHISFDYLVHSVVDDDSKFYFKLRRRTGSTEKYDNDGITDRWLWSSAPGVKSRVHKLFKPEYDQYLLLIGIYKKASWSIDNIVIEEVEPMNYPSFFKMKPGPDLISPALEKVDAYRRASAIGPALDDMLILMCNEGAGGKAIDRTSELQRRFDIDFVDWNRLAPLARRYGVRTSSGGPEYQEFYTRENKDMPPARLARLAKDGAQVSFLNTLLPQEAGWIPGDKAWYVCQNSPNWHTWFKSELWEETSNLMSVCQDNISVAPWLSGGCFCDPCQSLFRDYLRERYNQNDLGVLGIKSLDDFSILERIHMHGLVGDEALRNPLTREYIKFQNISQILNWADCVQHIHENIRERKRTTAVYGNQIHVGQHSPFAALLSPFNDIVQIEEVEVITDKPKSRAVEIKVARASGYEDRPVWIRGPVIDKGIEPEGPMVSPLYWTVHMTEALAAGGVRDFSLGYNRPPNPDGSDPEDYIDNPELMDHWQRLAAFKRLYRPLFTKRESETRVAIVYSIPSLVYRHYPPLGVNDGDRLLRHRRWAGQLESWHVPYDVVMFGHPEMFPDEYFLDRLEEYDVLLIPVGDAMTDSQVRALRRYLSQGGKVYTAEPAGVRDENWNERSDFEKPDLGAGAVLPDTSLDSIQDTLQTIAGVESNMPDTVQLNLWRSQSGNALDVHLVNFDQDIRSSTPTRVRDFTVTVPAVEGVEYDQALLIRPFEPVVEVGAHREGDKVTAHVPWIDVYGVVSFTSRERLAFEQEDAERRRELDRKRVIDEADRHNLY